MKVQIMLQQFLVVITSRRGCLTCSLDPKEHVEINYIQFTNLKNFLQAKRTEVDDFLRSVPSQRTHIFEP